jgi:hypothetical protein
LGRRQAGDLSRVAKDRDNEASTNGDDELERYKQAANDALQQLDWCIGYLVGLRKQKVASTLARNRGYIREQLMGEAAEPTPVADG